MSKKLDKHLKEVIKKNKSSPDFIKGTQYMMKLYTSALIDIFGKKAGVKASEYLIAKSLKVLPKKK